MTFNQESLTSMSKTFVGQLNLELNETGSATISSPHMKLTIWVLARFSKRFKLNRKRNGISKTISERREVGFTAQQWSTLQRVKKGSRGRKCDLGLDFTYDWSSKQFYSWASKSTQTLVPNTKENSLKFDQRTHHRLGMVFPILNLCFFIRTYSSCPHCHFMDLKHHQKFK